MRRKMACLLLAAVLTAAAGCSKPNIIDSPSSVARIGDDPLTTIVFWHTYSDEETRVFENQVIPAFEKAHPTIRIESVRQAYNQQLQDALIARASSGKPPDVVRMDLAWVTQFAGLGLLMPLSDYPEFRSIASRVNGRALSTNGYEGKYYGLPLNINTKVAIYNRKLLERGGLDAPPTSMDEVVALARKEHAVIGMAGLNFWSSLPYFFAFGGQFSDERLTRTDGYLNSAASVLAVRKMRGLFREGILNPDLLTGRGDLWNDVYREDSRLLMIDEGPWYYSILLHTNGLKADLRQATVPAPFPSSGTPGPLIGGEDLVMSKGTRHAKEAWAFIQWMMRKDTQETMFEAGMIPTNSDAYADIRRQAKDEGYIAAYLAALQQAYSRPPSTKWSQIETIYENAMKDVFLNGRDIQSSLDDASAKIDGLIRAGPSSD